MRWAGNVVHIAEAGRQRGASPSPSPVAVPGGDATHHAWPLQGDAGPHPGRLRAPQELGNEYHIPGQHITLLHLDSASRPDGPIRSRQKPPKVGARWRRCMRARWMSLTVLVLVSNQVMRRITSGTSQFPPPFGLFIGYLPCLQPHQRLRGVAGLQTASRSFSQISPQYSNSPFPPASSEKHITDVNWMRCVRSWFGQIGLCEFEHEAGPGLGAPAFPRFVRVSRNSNIQLPHDYLGLAPEE
ncbi:hypothetical protein C8R44DRAFT_739851 [Mycena epipterygia]|nr:hypothetical protein C8R44DRAFT_739851 [Mycena epipterygia]